MFLPNKKQVAEDLLAVVEQFSNNLQSNHG
jgi:hypothetical protein